MDRQIEKPRRPAAYGSHSEPLVELLVCATSGFGELLLQACSDDGPSTALSQPGLAQDLTSAHTTTFPAVRWEPLNYPSPVGGVGWEELAVPVTGAHETLSIRNARYTEGAIKL